MGLFDLLKKQKVREEKTSISPTSKEMLSETGDTKIEYVKLTKGKCKKINDFFIAFDLETTGLSPDLDRIIEIGAVAFENGTPVEKFSTLVNPERPIPAGSTAVNGITNSMVKNAPDEKTALLSFLTFCDKYSNCDLIFVSHNANFDFSFLKNALNRLGITKNLRYFDTLHASRCLIKGLPNYKQKTVANYLGLVNEQEHRAASDALVCGKILLQLAPKAKKDPDEFYLEPKNIPSKEEMATCAYIQKLIMNEGGDPKDLTYYKNSGGYVIISSFYEVARFKFAKKGHYLIVDKSAAYGFTNPTEDCTSSEGGTRLSRAFFSHPVQLDYFQRYLYEKYLSACASRDSFFQTYPRQMKLYHEQLPNYLQISIQTMDQLISELGSLTNNLRPIIKKDAEISRDMVTINTQITRIPLSKIKNKNDPNRGFDQGFPYYEKAEIKRKHGTEAEVQEAISLLDKARENGYSYPALYESYAKAYRKLKDYQNEILICEEGIKRLSEEKNHGDINSKSFERTMGDITARRNKAIQLLYKQQNPKK